ncbi:hypothetical protein GCM10010211_72150 [Streptomyces albospinus]|uniref:Uncharacterized protein n=1 Tax=Streptomyces albospinus TaxID=285515 RepID=A0ABQ2VKQ3_9ACTN|nr:hypothetical protein GCM10010211_72150 [Streptomyces albospinus]
MCGVVRNGSGQMPFPAGAFGRPARTATPVPRTDPALPSIPAGPGPDRIGPDRIGPAQSGPTEPSVSPS